MAYYIRSRDGYFTGYTMTGAGIFSADRGAAYMTTFKNALKIARELGGTCDVSVV